ncbi:uncharacterized protein LOC124196141 [Daphnia pulex]|uniref:uncharacterized protein LOC124196141 n=1 Tax=Daphnia pulex TaxID=6669 RepID=UPI001EDEC78D|nr:uncharacterized protein LOC124196141 [Daphnia pulex]
MVPSAISGLLVVTYTAPVELDESDSQKLRFESAYSVKREEEESKKQIERKYEGVVPIKFHSYSGNSGAVDGTDGLKVVSNANLNRETRAHFPTSPPMPEHKLKYEMNPIDGDLSVTEKKDDGSYSFSISESGSQRQVGPKPKDIGNVNRESYSDSILDNTAVNWVADENGIQVPSDHLLDSPPTDGGVGKMLADLKK